MKLSALAAQIKSCGHCEVINNGGGFLLAREVRSTAWTATPERRMRENWVLCWVFRRRR